MKKKSYLYLATGLLLGAAVGAYCYYKQEKSEFEKAQEVEDVRQFFSLMEPVTTLYIYEEGRIKGRFSGGVFLASGQHYTFDYDQGEITFREEDL